MQLVFVSFVLQQFYSSGKCARQIGVCAGRHDSATGHLYHHLKHAHTWYVASLARLNLLGGGTWPNGQRGAPAERSERCACVPKVAGSIPSGGSESTFHSDVQLTARVLPG
jgi:hypothetical protein